MQEGEGGGCLGDEHPDSLRSSHRRVADADGHKEGHAEKEHREAAGRASGFRRGGAHIARQSIPFELARQAGASRGIMADQQVALACSRT